ncbi:MAG: group-specific protein [Planctomycetota bacterium]
MDESDFVVVVVKHRKSFRWFRSERELWVLDRQKWTQSFIAAGYDVPPDDHSERFGIPIVNSATIDEFLQAMTPFEVEPSVLTAAFEERMESATSWWDAEDLFPVLFVDADRRRVSAFYPPPNLPLEQYVPNGWKGRYEDFATEAKERRFPTRERFWCKDGIDMLAVLNERGRANEC